MLFRSCGSDLCFDCCGRNPGGTGKTKEAEEEEEAKKPKIVGMVQLLGGGDLEAAPVETQQDAVQESEQAPEQEMKAAEENTQEEAAKEE